MQGSESEDDGDGQSDAGSDEFSSDVEVQFSKHDKLPMPQEGMDYNGMVEDVRESIEVEVDSIDDEDHDILNVSAVGLPSTESAQPTAQQGPKRPVRVSPSTASSPVLSGHGDQGTELWGVMEITPVVPEWPPQHRVNPPRSCGPPVRLGDYVIRGSQGRQYTFWIGKYRWPH